MVPAPSLGKETDINQGSTLGTVDMIISGPSFAARSYPRLGIAYYSFIFRDAAHQAAVVHRRGSKSRISPRALMCRSARIFFMELHVGLCAAVSNAPGLGIA